jgi:hypothetical protein
MADEKPTDSVKLQIAAEARDHRRLLLEEWRLYVQTSQDAAAASRAHGVSYAQIGLQSAFLVNGGALVALPPLMQWLPSSERVLIPHCAIYFLIGLVFSGFCSLVTYANFLVIGQTWDASANATATQLAVNYQLRDRSALDETEYVKNSTLGTRLNIWIKLTFWGGILSGVGAYVAFLIGAFSFISIVN